MILRRQLSTCCSLGSRFDSKIFVEPITNLDQLKKPLPPDDPRNFLHPKPMRSDQTPVFYRDHTIDKMTRYFTFDGRKEEMQQYINYAMERVKRSQYIQRRMAKTDAERRDVTVDPVTVVNKALRNCRPMMKLLPVVRGGTTYQVPFPVVEVEAEFRAMKFMKMVCRAKSFRTGLYFRAILTHEILLAAKNEGLSVKAKQEHHKICEANRAFSHYRKC